MNTEFEGFLFMNAAGKYLQIRERATHTGHHVEQVFVDSIDQADVFTTWHLYCLRRQFDFEGFVKLPARCANTRTVTLL